MLIVCFQLNICPEEVTDSVNCLFLANSVVEVSDDQVTVSAAPADVTLPTANTLLPEAPGCFLLATQAI